MSQAAAVAGHTRQRGSSQASANANANANAKSKTRSRNGCPTCKAKRLKCDETKPECDLCKKSGRKCPGYNQAFRWSTKHEKSLSARAKGPSNLKDLVTATSKTLSSDSDDFPYRRVPGSSEEPLADLDPCGTSQSGEDGCSDSELLPLDANGMLTPTLDNFIIPECEYGIEDLLQDIWQGSSPAYGPPPLEAANQEDMFGDQAMVLGPSSRSRSPFDYWSHGTMFDPLQQPLFPQIPRTITDRSSLLVEEWFRNVCPMWSSFDSDANPNRKLASESWSRSEAVMNCLQSMSAACLSSQMPHMRQVAISSLKNAIKALQQDLKAANSQLNGTFPTELLLALCCVGTAACWIDTKYLGGQFLREAKTLLKRATQASEGLSAHDRETLSFFNNSLIYWNMLVAVVSDEEDDLGIPRLKKSQNMELSRPIVPHPWTGVSATAQRLFAQAIRLCRRFRRHLKRESISTMRSLQTAMRDIAEAQAIEEELLSLEHYSIHDISDTGDRLTSRSHFIDVAEGYRLASLLQLYQTFPDLVARRLPEDAGEGVFVPWDRWIVPLSLRLVNTLRKIPLSSGTRCIQPLLYLTASTGLRFDTETLTQQQQQQQQQQGNESLSEILNDNVQSSTSIDAGLPFILDPDSDTEPDVSITRMSIEVSHGRRFIMERLGALEHSLPPAPVLVARNLVEAIWAGYDSEKPGTTHTHWIDVMEASDLRTIFG